MIDRLYIDNFRTLVNFELRLGQVSLLLGPNGTGKSSVLDVLHGLQRLLGRAAAVADVFPASELTRWENRSEQTFELDLRGEQGLFTYKLKLKHDVQNRRSTVESEILTLDDRPLFRCEAGRLILKGAGKPKSDVKVPYDNTSAMLSSFSAGGRPEAAEFKRRLLSMLVLRPCPPTMASDSAEEAAELELTAANFASWYRYIVRQDISRQLHLMKELTDAIDGFESLGLHGPADATVTLRAMIRPEKSAKAIAYKFGELSDGQRQLIVLYTLLRGLSDPGRILLLDEPENFLALSEIEPWLASLEDALGEDIAQAVIISHNADIIDRRAVERGIWFARQHGGPTRIQTGKVKGDEPLRPSEIEARGW